MMLSSSYWSLQDKVVGVLVATHLVEIKTGILIQKIGEEDHAPRTVEEDHDPRSTGGETITQTHTGGKGITPCLPAAVGTAPDKEWISSIASMIHPSNYLFI